VRCGTTRTTISSFRTRTSSPLSTVRDRTRKVGRQQTADHDGKYFFVEMHKIATENGQGFVDYQYAKPGRRSTSRRRNCPTSSCSRLAVDAGHRHVRRRCRRDNPRQSALDGAIALAFLILIGGFAGLVMFRLSNRLDGLSTAMASLAAGESDVALPATAGKDEVADMARAVQVFKDNAIERARLEAEALANRSQTEIERERAAAERAKAARSRPRSCAVWAAD